MKLNLIKAAAVASVTLSVPAYAQDMVFASWGGTTQDAQAEAWANPYTAATGGNVLQDGPTDYGKFRAMVESGNVGWDVVDVEYPFAVKAGNEGLLEPLDFSIIDRSTIDPRFVTDYAVGSFYFSFVLGSSKDFYGDATPQSWSDLFDLEKYPGKRAMYKWSPAGALEMALLADGVAPADLYPLDVDRAFAKLDTIKDEIVWWASGAQSQQLLASTETPLGMFWNGRIFALQQDGVNAAMSWDQNITAADMLVVPKGSPNKDAAMKFLAIAASAQGQADMARLSGYAPTNVDSGALLPEDVAAELPDRHTESQVDMDMDWWAVNNDEIVGRWFAWQSE